MASSPRRFAATARRAAGVRRRLARARCGGVASALLAAACAGEPALEPAAPRPPVETRAAVSPAVATTGDVITYTITIEHDPGLEVTLPEPGAEIAGFRIIDLGRREPRRLGDRIVEERFYELRADLVGSYVLPPVTVTYRPAGGDAAAEPQTVQTSQIFVEVASVLPADGEVTDIRDLKPLRRIAPRPPWWLLAALAAAAAALAAGLVVWLRRRRRGERPAAPPIPAHEAAFRALDALRRTDFTDPAAVRRFYFAVSEVVRAYVEGRFGLNATDLTTEEILARLAAVEALAGEPGRELGRFLTATDRVKFAAHRPAEGEIRDTYERALGFVEATRPPELEAAGV